MRCTRIFIYWISKNYTEMNNIFSHNLFRLIILLWLWLVKITIPNNIIYVDMIRCLVWIRFCFCEWTEVSYTCWIIITILKWRYCNINIWFFTFYGSHQKNTYMYMCKVISTLIDYISSPSCYYHVIFGQLFLSWLKRLIHSIYLLTFKSCCQEYSIITRHIVHTDFWLDDDWILIRVNLIFERST
jgi:hypothetical protein